MQVGDLVTWIGLGEWDPATGMIGVITKTFPPDEMGFWYNVHWSDGELGLVLHEEEIKAVEDEEGRQS